MRFCNSPLFKLGRSAALLAGRACISTIAEKLWDICDFYVRGHESHTQDVDWFRGAFCVVAFATHTNSLAKSKNTI